MLKNLIFFLFMAVSAPAMVLAAQNTSSDNLGASWKGLYERLVRDGANDRETYALLAQLPSTPLSDPMGRKIRELYQREFMPNTQKKVRSDTWYKGVVTEKNARLCRDYIKEHQAAFDETYIKYGVPPSIASALLFVETRLGRVLADVPENAFYVLASMAVSTSPESLGSWLNKLPGYENHVAWLDATLQKRSNWAYNEVLALVKHMIKDHIEPSRLPGSIYGAIGLCQFMPSNIDIYAADGNHDGRIDLFEPSDAIASLANYLAKHGWKKNMTAQARHKCLMTYNHSKVYANTILALANLVDGRPALSGNQSRPGRKK